MKTAISVPDELYERAERLAERHGMNRSQFYATAADRFAAELESAEVTEAIDAALAAAGSRSGDDFAVAAGRQLLGTGDEW